MCLVGVLPHLLTAPARSVYSYLLLLLPQIVLRAVTHVPETLRGYSAAAGRAFIVCVVAYMTDCMYVCTIVRNRLGRGWTCAVRDGP